MSDGFEGLVTEAVAKLVGEATGTATGEVVFKTGVRVVSVAWQHRIGWVVLKTAASKCAAVLLRRRGKHKVTVVEIRDLNCEGLWHWAATEHEHWAYFEKMMRDLFCS